MKKNLTQKSSPYLSVFQHSFELPGKRDREKFFEKIVTEDAAAALAVLFFQGD